MICIGKRPDITSPVLTKTPVYMTYCTGNFQSFICSLSRARADDMIQKHATAIACVAGGFVRRRKIRLGEFDFWRHVEQIQKEEKNWREGGGGGNTGYHGQTGYVYPNSLGTVHISH